MFCSLLNHQGGWRREGNGCLFFSLSYPSSFYVSFFDASTMEVTTSPNKKSDNKLHWIRMLGWMDDSRRVDGSDVNEHCFER